MIVYIKPKNSIIVNMSRLIIIIILLIVGIIFSVYLVLQNTSLFSKAAPDISPKKVAISNISDSSFTVSWVTDKETIGFVKYSQGLSLNETAYDERDEADGAKARITHFIVLKNLSPQQKYYFKITSQDQIFGLEDQPYEQYTAPVSEQTPPVPVVTFGKIKNGDGEIPQEAIIFLKLPDSTTLSTYPSSDGNFLMTVTNARSMDLSAYVDVKDGDTATVWAEGGREGNLSDTEVLINTNKALDGLTLKKPISLIEEPAENSLGDFNGDGLINVFDYAIMIKRTLKL